MEYAKNYEIRCKIVWTQNEWHLLPGNVIYDFWAQKFYKVVERRV